MDHAIPFRTSDGRVSSVDGIILDVTGRVKLQEQLIRSEGIKTISEVSARLLMKSAFHWFQPADCATIIVIHGSE